MQRLITKTKEDFHYVRSILDTYEYCITVLMLGSKTDNVNYYHITHFYYIKYLINNCASELVFPNLCVNDLLFVIFKSTKCFFLIKFKFSNNDTNQTEPFFSSISFVLLYDLSLWQLLPICAHPLPPKTFKSDLI